MSAGGEWEPDAENWVRWARRPDEAYWFYRDRFFDRIVGRPGRRTIEIGCGEGRVARDLAARGHRVVAVDTAATLVACARAADSGGACAYLLADGAALPFAACSFDVAVAYNSLQVVADMAATVHEASRVLGRGGRLCACMAHPVTDLGRFTGEATRRRFTLRPRYFETARVDERVERDGLEMTFRGWTYTLEQYADALDRARLRVESILEPRPVGAPQTFAQWHDVPLFMFLSAVKV
ncbi:MAG TPA: methyltransferase domain-containing protein [Acidimicrobiia bacterium]